MYQPCQTAVFIGRNEDGQDFYWLKDSMIMGYVRELGGAGLVGADVSEEQDVTGLRGEGVAAIKDLRFAILGRPETEERFWQKAKLGEPFLFGTSYPNITRQLFRARVRTEYAPGSAEALPYLFPRLDGICELVRTEDSRRKNRLQIFMDNLAPVRLMLVRQAESGTIKERN